MLLVCSDLFIQSVTVRLFLIISSHLITCQNVPYNLRTQSVYASIQYGQSLLLAIYGKILKGERLKIITTIVLKVEHFYNAVMKPM